MTATTEATDQAPAIDAPKPQTVTGCLTEVMRRVEVIRKERENTDAGKYMFRGVDDVMNAVGPHLRDLGLLCLPRLVEQETTQVEYGNKRTLAFRTRVQVVYRLIGPDASELEIGPVLGESIDTGDKGGAKAQSVAYREMWLRALCVPTGEKDPDESTYEIAKPEATFTDPKVLEDLRVAISTADNKGKLQAAWKKVVKAFEEDAKITKADADELTDSIKQKVAALPADAK
jgi:hypothetical protein